MRCSFCEPVLDRYVEGTLPAPRMHAIGRHIETCRSCRGLLDEMKVIDGLLATTNVPELPANFTFAVMAETGSLPAPREPRHHAWSFLSLYLAAAWVAAVLGGVLSGATVRGTIAAASSTLTRAAALATGIEWRVGHGLAQTSPTLAAFGFGVCLIDLAIAAVGAAVYLVVRPRLAAQLASHSEARP